MLSLFYWIFFVVIRCHIVAASLYCLPSVLYTELFSCSCDADSQMFLFLDTWILTINFVLLLPISDCCLLVTFIIYVQFGF